MISDIIENELTICIKTIYRSKLLKKHLEKIDKHLPNVKIIVADDSGCTLIKENEQNEDLKKRLELIELQEDIWYYCTDTLKMNTFDTICKKNYQKNININHPSLSKLKKITDDKF